MRIGYMMSPWSEIDPYEDSTLRLISESLTRGHDVVLFTEGDFVFEDEEMKSFGEVIIHADVLDKNSRKREDYVNLYNSIKLENRLVSLKDLDVMFFRVHPPIDYKMVNFLDSIKNNVAVINNIDSLKMANNKTYLTSFGKEYEGIIPKTYISNRAGYLKRKWEELGRKKMILKPLDGFGGEGVILLEESLRKNVRSLLEMYTKNDYVILQDYVEGAHKGDVRVIMIDGEPMGSIRRVPSSEDIRSNLKAGGHSELYTLSEREREICKKIGKKLKKDGLYLVGLDMIEGKLIEVNVMSPGGIAQINDFCGKYLDRSLIDLAERKVYGLEENRGLKLNKSVDSKVV